MLRLVSKYGDLSLSLFTKIKQDNISLSGPIVDVLQKLGNEIKAREEHKYDSYGKKDSGSWEVLEPQQFDATDLGTSSVDISRADFSKEETLLLNRETRCLLLNDIEELEYFLRQRLIELQSPDALTEPKSQDEQYLKLRSQCEN